MFTRKQFLNSASLALLTWLVGPAAGAAPTGGIGPGAAPEFSPLVLQPVYRVQTVQKMERLTGWTGPGAANTKLEHVAFLAVVTNEWPGGLVPLFAVEKTNRFELRRRAPRGEESFSEPLFFALPPEDEPDASKLAGRWELRAIRADGSKAFLAWELALEADQVSGRFDQNTEYRVAYLTGGSFRSNRLELRVDYFQDAYELTGEWKDGRLRGDWRHLENSERGTWEASRAASPLPVAAEMVPLYEWRRVSGDGRRYVVEGERMEPGWERAARPLCRVWRKRN